MNTQSVPAQAETYLGQLAGALADAPEAARAAALDDVRAHVEEALDSGRTVDEALAGLGPARMFAAQFRQELGLPEGHTAEASRGARILHAAAVVVAVLGGVMNVWLETAVGGLSLGLAVLLFIPALLAALPLVLSARLRAPVGLANAVVVTAFVVLTFGSVGAFYAPLALQLWVAVIVPWRVSKGLDLSQGLIWRVFGAVTVALPGLLLIAGMTSGSLGWHPVTVVIAAVLIALALGFALGVRFTAPVIAVLGIVLLVAAFFDPGMLMLGVWWVGGYYLCFGLGSSAAWAAAEHPAVRL